MSKRKSYQVDCRTELAANHFVFLSKNEDLRMTIPQAMLAKQRYSTDKAANPMLQQQVCRIMAKLKEGIPAPTNEPAAMATMALLAFAAPLNVMIQ